MEYKDIWNDICFRIKNKNQFASERDFQIIAETLFEKIGWLQYKREIVTQKVIPVGASNNVKPDIIIENNGKRLFVIELKKPNIAMSERNIEQLISYMRLLKLNFGILLGETLQVYYEIPNDNKEPQKIIEISFNNDSSEGIKLLKLLSKNDYSYENIKKYCEDKLIINEKIGKSKKYVEILCSEEGKEIIVNILKEKLSTEYQEEIIESILNEININITKKTEILQPIQTFIVKSNNQNYVNKPLENIDRLTPNEAKNLCKSNGINIYGNITFASLNKTGIHYWANPNIYNIQNNWWLLLNDYKNKKLHVIYIPADSIKKNQIKVRNDKPSLIDLQIKYGNELFEDSRSGIKFNNWLKKTITY